MSEISSKSTIKDVKEAIGLAKRKYADINRQELRVEPKGKFLKDEVTLEDLGLNTGEFDIPKRGSLENAYHKPMGASYYDRIPWGLCAFYTIILNGLSLHGLPVQVKQINACMIINASTIRECNSLYSPCPHSYGDRFFFKRVSD